MNLELGYDIGDFTDIPPTLRGELIRFLIEPATIMAMVDASESWRPAAGAIGEELLTRFGERITAPRVKMFIACIIRQVMEDQGFVQCEDGVATPDDPVFSTATRYARRHPY